MSFDAISLNELQTSAAASFTELGDKHNGIIVAIDKRTQTDPEKGTIKTFNDGTPRPIWIITLETETGDTVALWAKGGNATPTTGTGTSMTNAIAAAVKAAGAETLAVGGELAVAFTGEQAPKVKGMNATKLYTAAYRPPQPKAAAVPADDLFNS